MIPLLLFGTLLDDDLRAIVGGADLPARPAVLEGQAVFRAAGGDWPVLGPGTRAEGLLVDATEAALARFDYYEAAFGYRRESATALVAGDAVEATVYRPSVPEPLSGAPWSLEAWQRDWGPLTRQAAREAMALFGRVSPSKLARVMPSIRVRAASALRAAAEPMPTRRRSGFGRAAVRVDRSCQPYTEFFALRETELRHATFAGGTGAPVSRTAFLMCDAVTVLPYDPARDRVLVVEQFRAGAHARGDLHPWTLEPVAGRIDPGESPEQTAFREAEEETGLRLSRLEKVASYYTSPGATSEYIYSYIGLADLPDTAAGLGGLDSEGEDIRSHVLPFAELEALIASGEVDNAPLLVSALWLAPRRAALA
jgi:nudix-type nucleoside diphosphatase (YffH/AdpP family)